MEKEFIPYDQALELKELGFDEHCIGYYTHNTGVEMNKLSLTIHPKRNINSDISWVNKLYEGDVTAPLYQQAFRWFREKYGLEYIIESGNLQSIIYRYRIYAHHFGELVWNESNYSTHEEAELACLKKLIELAKNK